MLLLGIDLGTSSIKISVVDYESRKAVVTVRYPDAENEIISVKSGWAEQDPNMWWDQVKAAIRKAHATNRYNAKDIRYIGIAYQMHGLVLLDEQGVVLRDSIIWCDSRAVEIGQQAFDDLGRLSFLKSHLNSPGNFTASKLKWVKDHQHEVYKRAKHLLLPGDFLSYRFTGEWNTTFSALSEGILWDFERKAVSQQVLDHFGLERSLIPQVNDVFDNHGQILPSVAKDLGLDGNVQVTYKAGDQPNNALSLNVLDPGEVAATAGTSGVIYGVSDGLVYDKESRVNTFAHVNYDQKTTRTGVLLCINGTGILNSWMKKIAGVGLSYTEMNVLAEQAELGANGLRILPFGNGAERMLGDRMLQAQINQIDLNRHGRNELFRAVQEGIAFSFRYGLDIMRENGATASVIRAGHANLFLSPLFATSFAGATNASVELYKHDGSTGAALGAGIGARVYSHAKEALEKLERVRVIDPAPSTSSLYEELYQDWKNILIQKINQQ